MGYGTCRDHPRVCGEKCRCCCCLLSRGSPPRMRGKVFAVFVKIRLSGITPAYAGKSVHPLNLSILERDHPRVCGEKICWFTPTTRQIGSPPRMRGKVILLDTKSCHDGITPAYAGKSLTIPKLSTASRDHPRVCGEKREAATRRRAALGSPPRMRGKEKGLLGVLGLDRITPAYAGKRNSACCAQLASRDHPRVCGEKLLNHSDPAITLGSPPRMRGKVQKKLPPCEFGRITPAYAGKSQGACA